MNRRAVGAIVSVVTLLLPASVLAGTGGPDAFGYTWIDSFEPGVTYSWFDITTDTPDGSFTGDEVRTGPIDLGFSFDFYGTTYTQAWASTNGWLYLGGADPGSADLSNDCPLPSTNGIEYYVAGIHDDLDNDTGTPTGNVYYKSYVSGCPYDDGIPSMDGCFIVQWDGMYHFLSSPADDLTFQIVLFDSYNIAVIIQDASNEAGSGSTTGLENGDATIGLTFACNTLDSLSNDLLVFFLHPSPVPVELLSLTIE